MSRSFKKGIANAFLIIVALLLISAPFAYKMRRYVYMAYQNGAYLAGINVNDIASSKYVNFIKSQSGQKDSQLAGTFLDKKFSYEEYNSAQALVLGENNNSDKWIEVNLSEQKLYMHEGSNIVGTYLVSTGKWAPTPTGSWPIWTKLRYARMTGGSPALGTFYDLPNVPYTMYFNQGYGIHGAYWHNNFGHPMSHGCINMRPEEAGIVYNWASVGTTVTVHN